MLHQKTKQLHHISSYISTVWDWKTTFPKAKPVQIFFRDYKYFDTNIFKEDLIACLLENPHACSNYSESQNLFLCVFNIHAPSNVKYVRENEVPYMTKTLRKAIMTRSRLENKYQKTKSLEHKENFKKHKNYCNRLYKRERKKYYESLNSRKITDNKKFWNTMKPFLTDKGTSQKRITLIEDDKIISDDAEVVQTLNNFF